MKFSTWKGMNTTEISKELHNVYKNSAPLYRIVGKWLAQFNHPERHFEDTPRMDHPSTITVNENIEALERIGMGDRQISIRRLAKQLTIIREMMNNDMGFAHGGSRNSSHQFNVPFVSIVLSRAPATQPSKSGEVFSFYRNQRWVLDSPVCFSQAAGSQDLEETSSTNTNSTPPRKISWKDEDDDFLG